MSSFPKWQRSPLSIPRFIKSRPSSLRIQQLESSLIQFKETRSTSALLRSMLMALPSSLATMSRRTLKPGGPLQEPMSARSLAFRRTASPALRLILGVSASTTALLALKRLSTICCERTIYVPPYFTSAPTSRRTRMRRRGRSRTVTRSAATPGLIRP